MPIIELSIDSSGTVTGLNQYDKKVKSSQKKTESAFKKMRGSVGGFATYASGALAGIGFTKLVKESLALASTLNETQGIFDSAFSGMKESADSWSNELRKSYHMAEVDSKGFLSNLQLVTTGMGLAKKTAGKMSFELVKVGADLASAFDRKQVDVMNDIRSALSGSMETMDKYGVVIRQAQIDQWLLKNGVEKTNGAFTQAQKATATYNLIMERTKTTTGTTAREFEGWAGQLMEARKGITDVVTAVGTKLIPVFLPLLKNFNEIISSEKTIAKVSTGMVKILDFLADGFRGVKLAAKFAILAFAQVAKSVTDLLTPVDLLLDGLVALGAVDSNPLGAMRDVIKDLRDSALEGLKQSFNDAVEKSGSFTAALEKANREIQDTKNEAPKAAAGIKKLATGLDEAKDNAKKTTDETKKAKEEIEDLGNKSKDAGDKGKESFVQLKAAVQDVGTVARQTASDLQAVVAPRKGSKDNPIKMRAMAMTEEEMQLYRSMTPNGRGAHYTQKNSMFGGGGSSNIHSNLDTNISQSKAAMKRIMEMRTTVINNFNQQVTRSDVDQISLQQTRNIARA